jgi:hypothetical protein
MLPLRLPQLWTLLATWQNVEEDEGRPTSVAWLESDTTFPSSFGQALVLSHVPVVEEAGEISCALVRKRMDDQSRIHFSPPALCHHIYPSPLGVSTLSAHHVPLWSNGASKPLATCFNHMPPSLWLSFSIILCILWAFPVLISCKNRKGDYQKHFFSDILHVSPKCILNKAISTRVVLFSTSTNEPLWIMFKYMGVGGLIINRI